MNELEKKAYAYAIERQKDPNYPMYNWETEITDAYEKGYRDAIEKTISWLEDRMWVMSIDKVHYVCDSDTSDVNEFIKDFKKAMEK